MSAVATSSVHEVGAAGSKAAKRVEHFTVSERAARGKAARAEVPRPPTRRGSRPPLGARPGRAARGAGQDARARARPDPLRADAGLAVHLLPRRGVPDGRRPGRHAADRAFTCSSAATRTSRTSAAFAAPDRRLVFDINDFDETLPGPFEWDVKRLAASFAVAGRDRGFERQAAQRDRPDGRARLPRGDARASPAMRNLDLWYARLDVDEIAARLARPRRREQSSARARTSRRRRRRTACAPSRSSPRWSTASCGSSATRR